MPLEIHDLQPHLPLDLERLSRAVEAAAGEEDPDLSLSIVDDEAIRAVNRTHLGRDRPTDVIAFDYREGEGCGESIRGEIILSAETAVKAAKERGTDPFVEVVRYAVHGVLHLKGEEDRDPDSARAMWHRQELILSRLGYPTEPYPG